MSELDSGAEIDLPDADLDVAAAPGRELPRGVKPLLVLGKIREVLAAFSPERPELTIPEIRRATGLPPSTCQRIVANLVAEGFLDRSGDRYRIGLSLAYWAAPASTGLDVVQLLGPIVRQLRDDTGETSCVFRREGNLRVCVAMAETHHAVRREMHVGKLMPLHAGSASRVLLAWDDEAADIVLGGELARYTDFTITDAELLRIALAQTRKQGFAITSEERDAGAASVSAPVFDAQDRLVAAIGISGPTQRLTPQRCHDWTPRVQRAAREATRQLGGRST
ncbi:IclR family transcriptional regulator [Saccharopolyspora sp. K220]|uniref:IclR family transcriptional regulator n=1 Tax=Saccharopolyspora soli TaxID=2926618 RepID=UPI001F56786E|nr:IclR family transcriptional regulator [Saccharopolyspora soli]MCI2420826.1 IclR family transcriptional regulator [Saccharopolyspora soli]